MRRPTQQHDRSLLPAAIRAPLALVGRLAPAAAAGISARLFLATRRRRVPQRESRTLREAHRSVVPTAHGAVAAWSWGAGPPVLLVHGWEGRASQLSAFVPALRQAGLSAVALDAPGHGASPGRSSSLVAMADGLEAAGPRYGPFVAVVAHSAGAVAATRALGRGLAVGRAVFLAAGADLPSYARRFAAELGLGADFAERLRRRVEARIGVAWEELDPRRMAPSLRTPLLALHDRDDREAPLAPVEELVARWPGARLERTQGLGHNRILRDPGVVDRAVEFVLGGEAAAPTAPGVADLRGSAPCG
ncbi:MAG TPA: alpha/beta fold hydrolase [Thermoanaerobaculia bacterium]|nr:alpha/beta fold hydrolase [Thermoanaerobaculia bacterium]